MQSDEVFTEIAELGVAWYRQRQELLHQRKSQNELLPYNRLNEVCAEVFTLLEHVGNQSVHIERLLKLREETLSLPEKAVISGIYQTAEAIAWVVGGDEERFHAKLREVTNEAESKER